MCAFSFRAIYYADDWQSFRSTCEIFLHRCDRVLAPRLNRTKSQLRMDFNKKMLKQESRTISSLQTREKAGHLRNFLSEKWYKAKMVGKSICKCRNLTDIPTGQLENSSKIHETSGNG